MELVRADDAVFNLCFMVEAHGLKGGEGAPLDLIMITGTKHELRGPSADAVRARVLRLLEEAEAPQGFWGGTLKSQEDEQHPGDPPPLEG